MRIAEPKKKKQDSYFLARTQPVKSRRLLVHSSLPSFLVPSINGFSFLATWGCPHSSPWLQTRNCYSPPILNKPTFVEKKTGCRSASNQHLLGRISKPFQRHLSSLPTELDLGCPLELCLWARINLCSVSASITATL